MNHSGNATVIHPWQFLALVFRHLRRKRVDRVSFEDLNGYSRLLKSRYGIEVSWDKDEYNYCFGFYEPVFRLYGSDVCPEAGCAAYSPCSCATTGSLSRTDPGYLESPG